MRGYVCIGVSSFKFTWGCICGKVDFFLRFVICRSLRLGKFVFYFCFFSSDLGFFFYIF